MVISMGMFFNSLTIIEMNGRREAEEQAEEDAAMG